MRAEEFDATRFKEEQELRERHLALCRKYRATAGEKRTTPLPEIAISEAVPELRGTEATAVLLHPRHGDEPAADASKMGGQFLWPAAEPWPICEEHGIPYVTVLQLRAEEFPELAFPPNADLFQLLWCPREHEIWTKPKVFWRRRVLAKPALAANPPPKRAYARFVPVPCLLLPERVLEFPSVADLGEEKRQRLEQWLMTASLPGAKRLGADYYLRLDYYERLLAAAPGTKVAGQVAWIQESQKPKCQCGREMEHMLTIASHEFDAGCYERWLPIEDQKLQPEARLGFRGISDAPGLVLGDGGCIYYFVCRHCPELPVRDVCQC